MRRRLIGLVLLLFLLALIARLVPLQFSPLPYNIDGFPLARISELIIESGGVPSYLEYEGLIAYNLKIPVFSTLLAIFSLVLGVEPLTLLPYFTALIGSLAVVFVFALCLSFTKSTLASFGAGMFAALTGLFVYVTTAAMKQLLAIVFLIFILFLYHKREDWRFRLLMMLMIVLMPFTHHLSSLMLLLILSLCLAATVFRHSEFNRRNTKEATLDLLTGPAILLCSLYYYHTVSLEFYKDVINLNDAFLLLSVFIIMAVVARIIAAQARTNPWFIFKRGEERGLGLSQILDEKVLVVVVGIAVLYVNSRVKLFMGGVQTSDFLLQLMLPYLLLAIVAIVGFNVLRYSRFHNRHLLTAMFLAPLCLIAFAMLRDFDVFGFIVVYRSYSFIDIPLAITCGVGLAFVYKVLKGYAKEHREFRALPVGAMVIFVILCASALPLAYNNEKAFGIQEVTYEYEFEAMEWLDNACAGVIVSDQRYSDIVGPYFGIESDMTGPWLMKGNNLEEGEVCLFSMYWADGGAQMSTLGRVTFSKEWMASFTADKDLIYVSGPVGREMVVAVVR